MSHTNRADDPDTLDRVSNVLCGPGHDDERLANPPAGLFRQIEEAAAVLVEAAPVVVEYSIDCDDVVMSTGGDWEMFARQNNGEELASGPPRLSLWSQIQGADARSVWRSVVSEVRRSESAATVPFRCDGPAIRRWYEVDVSPGDSGSVDFRSRLVFEEPRPEVSMLARWARRETVGEPVRLCCWCARALDGDRWIPIDELVWNQGRHEDEPAPQISQGICRKCSRAMSDEAERLTWDH